ncbi:MAG: gamma-glutamyl-gamma-aminobutyrate hydrolase family protein [Proteobacteria bacterium]|nr:gamma-glutamyl-gamma-aminobutyrate hydrolase family protein [Pseudomonadota bacterium]
MRIAVTMRIVDAVGYAEPRDALAQDWGRFLAAALPGAAWMPLPNIGETSVGLAEQWQIDRIIFSGGNDLGERPLRDATERALIAWARMRNIPVFGVCRGLQLLQEVSGGTLAPVSGHAGTRHSLRLVGTSALGTEGNRLDVNSFHNWCIQEPASGLRVLAVDSEGNAEAMVHRTLPLGGLLWHPEREPKYALTDIAFIRHLFCGETP